MSFPISPVNAQTTVVDGIQYQYNSVANRWLRVASSVTATNHLTITDYTNATSPSTGALVVQGGVGIGSDLWISGNSNIAGTIRLTNPTNAGSTATGALVVTGGVGIGSNLYVGGSTLFQGPVTFAGTATYILTTNTVYTDNIIELHTPPGGMDSTWTIDDGKDIGFHLHYFKNGADANGALLLRNDSKYLEWFQDGIDTTSNGNNFTATTYGTFKTGSIILANTTASVSTTTGALVIAGGVGIGGDLNVNSNVIATNFYGNVYATNTSTINVGYATTSGYAVTFNTATLVATAITATFAATAYSLAVLSNTVTINNPTGVTSTNSGALQIINGGVGIGGGLYVGATLTATNIAVTNFTAASGQIAGAEIVTTSTFSSVLGTALETITYLPYFITQDPALVPVPVVGTSNIYGTYNFGSLSDIQTFGDYNTATNTGFYSVNDATGAPAHVEYIGWSGLTKFNRVVLNINYTQSSGHTIDMDLYNFQKDSWDTLAIYSGSPGWQQFALGVIDDVSYLSNTGTAVLRIYHVSAGNTAHRTWIDYVAIEQSTTGGQGPRGATGATGATGAQGVNTGTTTTFVISNVTQSSSTTTGALQVQGGVGIGQDLWVGGTIHGNISGTITTATTVLVNNATSNTTYYVALADNKNADANLDADTALTYDTTNGMLVVPNTSATSISVVNNVQIGGTVTITGGQGYVTILSFNGVSFLSNSVTGFVGGEVITPQSNGLGLSVGTIYYVKAVLSPTRFILSLTPTGSPVGSVGTQTITGTVGTAPGLQVTANLTSTSTTTGGLVVVGGAGIGGDLNVGGRIIGGGVRTNSSSTPPLYPAPTVGDIWYNSTNDAIYRYTADGAGQSYWLDITGPVVYTTI